MVTVEWNKHCSLQGLFLIFFQVEALSVVGAWVTDEILRPFLEDRAGRRALGSPFSCNRSMLLALVYM